MKISTLLLLQLLVIYSTFSQVVLTHKNNSPLPGDTIVTKDILPVSPGNAGPNQVWDFSKIQYTGEKNVSFLYGQPTNAIDNLSNFNVTLNDRGYEYLYKIDENSSEVVGLSTKGLSVVFSDPIVKIKYPVLYGIGFKDEFTGVGLDTHKSNIAISGDYSLKADAYGTLIMHDRIIKDALRLTIEESRIQINPCNIYEIKTTTYYWYAPGARYPVIGLSTRKVKTNGENPVVTNTAFVNREMSNSGIFVTGSGQDNYNTGEVSLNLYPNPFTEKLIYSYFLRKQMPVSIELVDMTGKTVVTLSDKQLQAEGLYEGELDAVKYGLKMGVYNFRLKYGEKILVSKVVKL